MMFIDPLISSKEDKSSVRYQGRAERLPIFNTAAMKSGEWRQRLSEAIQDSGKSKRAVSLESGNGPGYVHSILTEGKDPTVQKLVAVCDALNVSAAYIIYGIQVSPKEAELLKLIQDNPDKRDAILSLLGD